MSLADESDFWAQVRLIAREEASHFRDGGSVVAEDGIIADGSYNAKDGTVSVWLIETASIISNGTEQPLLRQGIQLLTPIHGQQAGPVGGERVILIRRHSGWLAVLEHGKDDSPGAPAGEHWYAHKSGSYHKFQNSGNVSVKATAAHQITAATISHTSSGNSTFAASGNTAINALNVAITGTAAASLIAPSTQVGPPGGPYLNIGGGGLGSGYAVVRVLDLVTLLYWLSNHEHSGVQSGSSNTGVPVTAPPSVSGSPVTSTG